MQNVIADHKARHGLEGSGGSGVSPGRGKSSPQRRLATASRALDACAVLGVGGEEGWLSELGVADGVVVVPRFFL